MVVATAAFVVLRSAYFASLQLTCVCYVACFTSIRDWVYSEFYS